MPSLFQHRKCNIRMRRKPVAQTDEYLAKYYLDRSVLIEDTIHVTPPIRTVDDPGRPRRDQRNTAATLSGRDGAPNCALILLLIEPGWIASVIVHKKVALGAMFKVSASAALGCALSATTRLPIVELQKTQETIRKQFPPEVGQKGVTTRKLRVCTLTPNESGAPCDEWGTDGGQRPQGGWWKEFSLPKHDERFFFVALKPMERQNISAIACVKCSELGRSDDLTI